MNNEVKAKWLEALRSGEYKQAMGYLQTPSGFCCLGVLCDLYGKEHKIGWTYVDIDGGFYCMENGARILPIEVREWAGLTMADPVVEFMTKGDGCDLTLATMNDRGSPFNEIADMIEEKL